MDNLAAQAFRHLLLHHLETHYRTVLQISKIVWHVKRPANFPVNVLTCILIFAEQQSSVVAPFSGLFYRCWRHPEDKHQDRYNLISSKNKLTHRLDMSPIICSIYSILPQHKEMSLCKLTTHTTVLLHPSLQQILPPHLIGDLLQWRWWWCCRELWEQELEEAHWWSLVGRCPWSEVEQWKQESCTQSWSRYDELHADAFCILAGKPEKMQ